jgi:hypothetical protein
MEPRHEDRPRTDEPRPEAPPKRFRLVRLEERFRILKLEDRLNPSGVHAVVGGGPIVFGGC